MEEKKEIINVKDELAEEYSDNEKVELITLKAGIIHCPNLNCQKKILIKFMGEIAAFIQTCPICKVQFTIWIDSKTSTYEIGGISNNFKKGILSGKITFEKIKATDFIISCPSCNKEYPINNKQYVESINCKTCNTKFVIYHSEEEFYINILEKPETNLTQQNARFCARCGLNVSIIARFCPRCGLKILRDSKRSITQQIMKRDEKNRV